ncbi:MAG: ABC transporter ATP-binding protein [Patescibacteria group bacterium]|nr:ABC transporter ATP-binding protein [Patescibacteria group bacterium]MDE1944475.1 ABC transporter ATP-binding protein [Patescibacteria group bacterium]MDE2057647.1 ABC transporter ATP-binding protein [Patescibacteria group bacterium]
MIEVKNVTKTYGAGDAAFQALKGVSFTIDAGEFVAIMGPSGSGKSTTMHILGCLDTPTSGTYRLKGKKVSDMTDEELAKIRSEEIGFVFQSFNLLARTTVARNVMLPLIYDEKVPVDERAERVRAAVRAAGLDESLLERKSNQLSGGQIQRVAIARALVNDPALILADEPTGNLDTKTGELVLGTFQKLNEGHGRTIVVITHEPEVAEHAARIITVRDGLIVSDSKTHARRRAELAD